MQRHTIYILQHVTTVGCCNLPLDVGGPHGPWTWTTFAAAYSQKWTGPSGFLTACWLLPTSQVLTMAAHLGGDASKARLTSTSSGMQCYWNDQRQVGKCYVRQVWPAYLKYHTVQIYQRRQRRQRRRRNIEDWSWRRSAACPAPHKIKTLPRAERPDTRWSPPEIALVQNTIDASGH